MMASAASVAQFEGLHMLKSQRLARVLPLRARRCLAKISAIFQKLPRGERAYIAAGWVRTSRAVHPF